MGNKIESAEWLSILMRRKHALDTYERVSAVERQELETVWQEVGLPLHKELGETLALYLKTRRKYEVMVSAHITGDALKAQWEVTHDYYLLYERVQVQYGFAYRAYHGSIGVANKHLIRIMHKSLDKEITEVPVAATLLFSKDVETNPHVWLAKQIATYQNFIVRRYKKEL